MKSNFDKYWKNEGVTIFSLKILDYKYLYGRNGEVWTFVIFDVTLFNFSLTWYLTDYVFD